MVLWFVATVVMAVWVIFHDPSIDYRLVVVGALLPDALDVGFGGARLAHTLVASVTLLVVVVLATIGRRALRRRLLALPIATFLHLVFDAAWSRTQVFWWPAFGWSFDDAPLPSAERGWFSVVLEALGLALLVWVWRRFGLADTERRRLLLRTGRLTA